jgi:hypothetical protein
MRNANTNSAGAAVVIAVIAATVVVAFVAPAQASEYRGSHQPDRTLTVANCTSASSSAWLPVDTALNWAISKWTRAAAINVRRVRCSRRADVKAYGINHRSRYAAWSREWYDWAGHQSNGHVYFNHFERYPRGERRTLACAEIGWHLGLNPIGWTPGCLGGVLPNEGPTPHDFRHLGRIYRHGHTCLPGPGQEFC